MHPELPIVGDKISVMWNRGSSWRHDRRPERAVVTAIDHVDKLVLFALQDQAHNYGRAEPRQNGDAALALEGVYWARG